MASPARHVDPVTRPHILIAEDEDILCELMARMARGWGYEVTTVSDGQAALAALLEPTGTIPEILLLDWVLPGMDGLQVCRTIRERELNCYVIMLSANDNPAEVEQAIACGVDDFLSKGGDPVQLKLRLRAARRITILRNTLLELKKAH